MKTKTPIKNHCECDEDSRKNPNPSRMYKPEEKIGMKHKPKKCKCVYGLKQYERSGKILTLCSCCNMFGDKLV